MNAEMKEATVGSSSSNIKLLLAQTTSSNTHEKNIIMLTALAEQAASQGCDMLCLPEASGLMNQDANSAAQIICDETNDPYVAACQALAEKHSLWIHNGSTPVMGAAGLPVNRTHLIDAHGQIVARYDKIHLFDIYLPDGKERLESKRYSAGEQGVVVQTPWGLMGLSICYDLRFPQLYRDYALAGARLIFVPSAFTRRTGAAHWEVLLRARAIENGCFIVAAAQTGEHDDGRRTYGHSMLVHPWGDVVCDLEDDVHSVVVELDLVQTNRVREQIPVLSNVREYQL